MTVALAGAVLVCAAAGWRYLLRARRMLHLLQLEHYENARLYLWLRRRGELTDAAQSAIQIALAILGLVLAVTGPALAELLAWLALLVALAVFSRREPAQGRMRARWPASRRW